jgi:methylthioribose-1-phosphate isomerase
MAQQAGTTIKHDNNSSVYKVTTNSLIEQFSMVGRLNTMHSKKANPRNIDIVDLVNNLPPTAINLFKMIKDNLDFKTNEATLDKPKDKGEQKRRSNATKHLKKHDAIKKTGQRSYIVNPYLIVPPVAYQEDILTKWNSLP